MNVSAYRKRNNIYRLAVRVMHPWPIYRRVGGLTAVVNHADGTKEDLGVVADSYAKRWGVGTR